MSVHVVGTCSLCGGAVVELRPSLTEPHVQRFGCQDCGAVPKQKHGPTIEMQPVAKVTDTVPRGVLKKVRDDVR